MSIKNVAIVVEAFLSGASLLISFFATVKARLASRKQKGLRNVLLAVPRAILEAEVVFHDGYGEQKKAYALTLLKDYCSSYGIDFDHYAKQIESALEDCLATPQKKLEVEE